MVWHTFFDAVIMAEVKQRPLRLQAHVPCCFRRGREPAGDLTAASARLLPPLLLVHFWPYQPSRLLPRLTDP